MARRLDYQEALRRPGTSPRMVASRSLLRPRPNLLYTARGRPVRAQRVAWREGEESRGSFCSLTTASIFSSKTVSGSLMFLFSSSRLAASFIDRQSVVQGKSVSVRVELGGRRLSITKHTATNIFTYLTT